MTNKEKKIILYRAMGRKLTARQIAEKMNLNIHQVYDFMRRNNIPFQKIKPTLNMYKGYVIKKAYTGGFYIDGFTGQYYSSIEVCKKVIDVFENRVKKRSTILKRL